MRWNECAHGVRIAAVLLLVPAAAAAQTATPADWRWATDAPARVSVQEAGDSAWFYVAMPPGWHITMGPGGVLWHPESRAAGRFTVESRMFLFPDSPPEAAAGLILGGRELDGAAGYLSFVVRGDGSFAVLRTAGGRTEPLIAWQRHDAVPVLGSDGTAASTLVVDVGADTLAFRVNDQPVGALPRAAFDAEGFIGLRMDRGANVHVSTFDLTRRFAPAAPAR